MNGLLLLATGHCSLAVVLILLVAVLVLLIVLILIVLAVLLVIHDYFLQSICTADMPHV
jgi:hypothetical protein